MERFGTLKRAAVIDCGCGPHVITAPASLENLVNLQTKADALEYVMFFSSYRTFDLFDLGGLVEVGGFGVSSLTHDDRFLVAEEFRKSFGAIYHDPRVADESTNGQKRFRIDRIAISTDGRVYEIEEYVSGNGVYRILNKRVLLQNSMAIGIPHFGAI